MYDYSRQKQGANFMILPVCQKCSSIAAVLPESQQLSFVAWLLKWIAGYRQLHCSNCGTRWNHIAALSVFGLLERVIYLILAGEVGYLLWSHMPHWGVA